MSRGHPGGRRRLPLAVKLTAATTLAVVVAIGIATLLTVRREERVFRSELQWRAVMTLDALHAAASDRLYHYDADFLGALTEGLAGHPVLIAAIIYDATGRIIADGSGGIRTLHLEADAEGQRFVSSQTTLFDWRPDRLIAGRPVLVGRQRLGAIRVDLATSGLQASMAAVRRQGAAAALAAIGVGVLIAILLSGSVTGPLRELTAATRRVASGHLNEQIPVRSSDEIADLTAAFNTMSARLREMIEGLEQRVLNRTAELRTAKEEAERASRAKTEFLSRMSHELRTPLNAVLGFAQLLEMNPSPADVQEASEHILKGGRHLLGLINEVLDLSRIEAGTLMVEGEQVPVAEVVHESLDLIAPLAAGRALTITAQPAPAAWALVADRQRFKQVLLNLLSNAIKYNRDQGVVTLSYDVVPENRLRIAITDTGPGIPPEHLDRLFAPFERLDAERSGIEGAGIGLALAKRLIEMMGGKIGVTSRPGNGSTFWVEMRMVEPLPGAPESATAIQAVAHEGALGERTILYIEDDLANIRLLERIVKLRPGIRLITAMQGDLGLDLSRQYRPDLILLNVNLPDMSGGDVIQHLRSRPETKDIPVVVVSADATETQLNRLMTAGARAYLIKPLDVRQVLDALNQVLSPAPVPG